MASSSDTWIREFNEASKLAEDIGTMISERSSLPASGPDIQRHLTAIRRKITILRTRLESLESILLTLPSMQPMYVTFFEKGKELHKRQDMLSNLKSKANQMASALNMSNFANRFGFIVTLLSAALSRTDLLGENKKSTDVINRTAGLDNYGVVGLQRQIMKASFDTEQDEDLEKLEETVISTKHIALTVNEELDLHTGLIFCCFHIQRVQKRLAILNKRTKGGCSCQCLLLSVVAIVVLAVVVWALIKYL
ncbi:hypothetical protein BHM03_00045789 [Ensete ventricosum]|nr:hypothetical protein BHM03_00045789 [Ensete ventricosum]